MEPLKLYSSFTSIGFFKSRLLLIATMFLFFHFFSSITKAANDPNTEIRGCFRLEGLYSVCAGGGNIGGPPITCDETCDPAKQANLCQSGATHPSGESYQVCTFMEYPKVCYGTKCCDTCKDLSDRYTKCQSFSVCGVNCDGQGTKPNPDCSKSTCPDFKTVQCTQTKQTCYYKEEDYVANCASASNDKDGCSCSCGIGASGHCEASGCCASCGDVMGTRTTEDGCDAEVVFQVTGFTIDHVPRVSDGNCGCKCPDTAVTRQPPGTVTCGQKTIDRRKR